MKNLYIPKGKTLHYETLYCQNIVNDGTLIVDGTLHARSISGKGILKAGTVSVRHVAEMDIECATMNGETMAAERVCAAEIVLSGSATVSCYLEAEYVEVPKLTMAKHNIGTLKADDVITLPEKKRGIVGTLVAGFFRRLWLSVIHRIPVDAPYVQVAAPAPESTDTEQEQPKPERAGDFQSQPVTQPMDLDLEEDFEFKRLKAMYRLLKDCGYLMDVADRFFCIQHGAIVREFSREEMKSLPSAEVHTLGLRTPDLYQMAFQQMPSAATDEVVLETQGLHKAFDGTVVAEHLDFVCHRGEIVGIIGPNGTGKSTFGRIFAGLLKENSGEVFLFGHKTRPRERMGKVRSLILCPALGRARRRRRALVCARFCMTSIPPLPAVLADGMRCGTKWTIRQI